MNMTDYDRYESACVFAGNRVLGHPISAVQLAQICTLIVHHCRMLEDEPDKVIETTKVEHAASRSGAVG
jgi:hypothetical protein